MPPWKTRPRTEQSQNGAPRQRRPVLVAGSRRCQRAQPMPGLVLLAGLFLLVALLAPAGSAGPCGSWPAARRPGSGCRTFRRSCSRLPARPGPGPCPRWSECSPARFFASSMKSGIGFSPFCCLTCSGFRARLVQVHRSPACWAGGGAGARMRRSRWRSGSWRGVTAAGGRPSRRVPRGGAPYHLHVLLGGSDRGKVP